MDDTRRTPGLTDIQKKTKYNAFIGVEVSFSNVIKNITDRRIIFEGSNISSSTYDGVRYELTYEENNFRNNLIV